jgi:hypothetical protein
MLIDGALALAIALSFPRNGASGLFAAAFADAIGRIGLGISVFTLPGIPYFTITFVLFIAGVAATAMAIGASALAAVVLDRKTAGWRDSVPLVTTSGVVSILFGLALLVVPGSAQRRALFSFYVVTLGTTLLLASLARARARSRLAT